MYAVDPNTKSLNYMKIWLKGLIYFELEQTLNWKFELQPVWIKPQLNSLQIDETLN